MADKDKRKKESDIEELTSDMPTTKVDADLDEDVVEEFELNNPDVADDDEPFVPPGYQFDNNFPPPLPNMGGSSDDDRTLDLGFLEEEVPLIPASTYPARLSDSRKTVSNNSGNPLLIMDFTLLPHPDVPEVYRGKEYPLFLALIPAVGWKIKRVGEALGMKFSKGGSIDLDAIQNTMVYIEIEHREYQGEIRASVKDVFPFPDGPGMKWQPGMSFGTLPS